MGGGAGGSGSGGRSGGGGGGESNDAGQPVKVKKVLVSGGQVQPGTKAYEALQNQPVKEKSNYEHRLEQSKIEQRVRAKENAEFRKKVPTITGRKEKEYDWTQGGGLKKKR